MRPCAVEAKPVSQPSRLPARLVAIGAAVGPSPSNVRKMPTMNTSSSRALLPILLVAVCFGGVAACDDDVPAPNTDSVRADGGGDAGADAGVSDAGADVSASGTGTCRNLKNCRLKCTDATCQQACDAQTAPAAKAQYDAVEACLVANHCTTDICAERKCGALVNTCLERPASYGSYSCDELRKCVQLCDGEIGCTQTCTAKASIGVQEVFTDLATCADANACGDDACLEQKCGAKLDLCLDRVKG
jgi:hypothetical protein